MLTLFSLMPESASDSESSPLETASVRLEYAAASSGGSACPPQPERPASMRLTAARTGSVSSGFIADLRFCRPPLLRNVIRGSGLYPYIAYRIGAAKKTFHSNGNDGYQYAWCDSNAWALKSERRCIQFSISVKMFLTLNP